MRALTRPEGKCAVDRVVVSGWWMACDCAAVYQVWNWVRGDGERSVEVRVEVAYWSSFGAIVVSDLRRATLYPWTSSS